MTTIDIEAELRAYDRATGKAKEKIGQRLLKAGGQISERADRLGPKLDKAFDVVTVGDDEWIEKLREYERLSDMESAIKEKVLCVN